MASSVKTSVKMIATLRAGLMLDFIENSALSRGIFVSKIRKLSFSKFRGCPNFYGALNYHILQKIAGVRTLMVSENIW